MTQKWNDEIWLQIDGADDRPKRQPTALARGLMSKRVHDVLDLGCGSGVDFAMLGERGTNVVGADQSGVALERAAARGEASRLVRVSDDCRLPLDDNSFDLVWCRDTLEHVLDTQTLLSEARRVLRPFGRLVVVTPNHPLRLRLRLAFLGWERHFDPMSPHLRFFTRRSLRALLSDLGFAVDEFRVQSGQIVAVATRR